MASPPLVSIVIPNFNFGRFLPAAIDSALAQTHPAIEAVVVDDGSGDDSRAVISGYGGRIRSVFQENQGLAAARNSGIAAANGDFLLFLDSDDILEPGAVAGLLRAREQNGGGDLLVYGDSLLFDGAAARPVRRREHSGMIWRKLLAGNFIHCHEVLVPRGLLLAAGGFDPGLKMSEDFDLWLRLAEDHPFLHVKVLVARRRVHGGMMSQRASELQEWAGLVLARQRRCVRGPGDRLALASGLGRNFHVRAWLAKERQDWRAMGRMSLQALRWQPWRLKNWLYLACATAASLARACCAGPGGDPF